MSAHSDFVKPNAHACIISTISRVHFWQNDRGLLRVSAVTLGWNEHRIRVRTTKWNLEKTILPPLLPRIEPTTRLFDHESVVLPKASYSDLPTHGGFSRYLADDSRQRIAVFETFSFMAEHCRIYGLSNKTASVETHDLRSALKYPRLLQRTLFFSLL